MYLIHLKNNVVTAQQKNETTYKATKILTYGAANDENCVAQMTFPFHIFRISARPIPHASFISIWVDISQCISILRFAAMLKQIVTLTNIVDHG